MQYWRFNPDSPQKSFQHAKIATKIKWNSANHSIEMLLLYFWRSKFYVVRYHYCHVVGWRKMIPWDVLWMRWFVFQTVLYCIKFFFELAKDSWSWGLTGHVPSHVPGHMHTSRHACIHTQTWKKQKDILYMSTGILLLRCHPIWFVLSLTTSCFSTVQWT